MRGAQAGNSDWNCRNHRPIFGVWISRASRTASHCSVPAARFPPFLPLIGTLFSCQSTVSKLRVSLGLGGFQKAAPIYRNPVAGSLRLVFSRALGVRLGQAGGGTNR